MLVRIGPDGVKLSGRVLLVTEAMLSLPQPVTYTCIARNQVGTVKQHQQQQQQQQQRLYRREVGTQDGVRSDVTFTVG